MSHAVLLSEAHERKTAGDALLFLNSMVAAISGCFAGKSGQSGFKKFSKELQKACTPVESREVKDQKSALSRAKDLLKGGKR